DVQLRSEEIHTTRTEARVVRCDGVDGQDVLILAAVEDAGELGKEHVGLVVERHRVLALVTLDVDARRSDRDGRPHRRREGALALAKFAAAPPRPAGDGY